MAAASLAGIAPSEFLKTDDDLELRALILVAEKAFEFQELYQKNLAAQIINFLGKSLGLDKKT